MNYADFPTPPDFLIGRGGGGGAHAQPHHRIGALNRSLLEGEVFYSRSPFIRVEALSTAEYFSKDRASSIPGSILEPTPQPQDATPTPGNFCVFAPYILKL